MSKILSSRLMKREAPAVIPNDGKQTPMKGHSVFIAQHATATCCRECIRKWHKMKPGVELTQIQQDYLVDVIMKWIKRNTTILKISNSLGNLRKLKRKIPL